MKTRTFYVPGERREVHLLGDMQLVFLTKVKPEEGVGVPVQKILVRNDPKRTAAVWGERSTRRWQIELFFQGIEQHTRPARVAVSLFPQGGSVGAGVPDRVRVLGMVSGAAVGAARWERRRASLVAVAAELRLTCGRASGRRSARPDAAVSLVRYENGSEEAAQMPARSATAGMQDRWGTPTEASGLTRERATSETAHAA